MAALQDIMVACVYGREVPLVDRPSARALARALRHRLADD